WKLPGNTTLPIEGTKRNWKEGIASFIAPPVYHGTMTVRRAAFSALAAFVLWLPSGCATTQDHALSFEQGEHQARAGDLRVDVVEARYAERQLTVECAIVNAGDTAVTIDREGVLLEDNGLEIPPVALVGDPTNFTIPAGASRVLRFSFAINGLKPWGRTLGLWVIRSPSAPLPPLRVAVPGIQNRSA
ncbi:MAG: hypothetical protein KUG77_29900, partial [Nannocystaceae bacterium]|nr:hypothetical protein [Nannocystaceae bacterium]